MSTQKRREPKLSEREFARVIENRGLGFNSKESAKQIGISTSSVNVVLRVFDDVRNNDWNDVAFLRSKQATTVSLIKWAADRLGKDIPDEILDVPVVENGEPADKTIAEKENEGLWILETLEQLKKQTDLLCELKKAIDDLGKTIIENANANGDAINGTLLDIRQNTRKRGAY